MLSGITSGVVTATRASVARAYVGTSGWSYPTWRGGFYPPRRRGPRTSCASTGAPAVGRAEHERVPTAGRGALQRWAEQVRPDFRFAVRMPRLITHGSRSGCGTFCERVRLLGERLGPVLVVLDRPRGRRLSRCFCSARSTRSSSTRSTSGTSRGPAPSRAGDRELRSRARRRSATCACASRRTTTRTLAAWAQRLRPLLDEGVRVYCYFKHEDEPTGPLYAERLLDCREA